MDLQARHELYIEPYRINFWWAFIHDFVAHPLLAVSGCALWAVKFHDLTSDRSYRKNIPVN